MNLVAKNLVVASILAAAVATATSASALPVRGTETIDDSPTTPTKTIPTRGTVVTDASDLGYTPVVLASKFQEPTASTKMSQTAGAVPESQSTGGTEVVDDLGNLDDVQEAHVTYGAIRTALPVAKVYSPVVASTTPAADVTPATGAVFAGDLATRATKVFDGTWTATCGGTPVPSYSRTWHQGDDFGNSKFGAGYDVGFTLASTASSTPNMDKISGEAYARAFATLFGYNKDLAKVSAKAALQGNNGTSSISVRVLGTDIWSRSVAGNLTENKDFSKTFFSGSQRIWLGPVPVNFTATANGAVGYSYSAGYVAPNVTLQAKPYVKAYATATAAIDAVVASAGVTGTLVLIEASVPAIVKLGIQPTYLTYNVDVDFVLKSLSGKIEAWAKVWYLFGSHKWTTTLTSWNGFSATYPLATASGCLPLP